MNTHHNSQFDDRLDATAALSALEEVDRINEREEANTRTRIKPIIALILATSFAYGFTVFSMFAHWDAAMWISLALLFALGITTVVLMKKLNVSRSSLQDPFERKWSVWSWGIIFLPLSGIGKDLAEANGYPAWSYVLGVGIAVLSGYCAYRIGMEDLITPGQQRDQLGASNRSASESEQPGKHHG